jgi:hypothetical protein
MTKKRVLADGVTLYCGDCCSPLQQVNHVITDPPYEERMQTLHEKHKLRRRDNGPERNANATP